MGILDDLSDDDLAKEVKRRKRSAGRDEVVILRGRHAIDFLKGNSDDDEDDDDDDDDDDSKKPKKRGGTRYFS